MPEKEKPKYGFCPECGSSWIIKAGSRLGATGRMQRYACRDCGHKTVNPRPPQETVKMRKSVPVSKRYIVTAAQNATPIHDNLWKAILNCAEYYDAEIIVIPGRYKNPTSQWTEGNDNHEWWDAAVLPYLTKGTIALGDRLTVLGDVKVQWAAMNPLASMETLTGECSGIVGHSRRALRSIATPQHRHPKMMFTTGCVTRPNYTDTKQGKIAHFHHAYGALIVEVDDDRFHVRQLSAMRDGSFVDIDKEFTADGVRDAPRMLSITMGDTHWVNIDEDVRKATFDDMVSTLNPYYLVWHDVLDQYARNHHHKGNWLVDYKKHKFGEDSVKDEVDTTLKAIVDNTPTDAVSIVVSSNHDQALKRWLNEANFKTDVKNAEFYLQLASEYVSAVNDGDFSYDPFISYGRQTIKADNVRFLDPDESFVLKGVEHGLHGDKGPNGSRGTTRNLSRIGVKVTKGHSHTAEIIDGCYSVGKSTGKLEYESGPSSHSNTHCFQYYNGKRSLVTIVNGKWRL